MTQASILTPLHNELAEAEMNRNTLRQKAEMRLHGSSRHLSPNASLGDRAMVIHELQIHQVELEIQNELLRAQQVALEESRQRLVDLFESTPIAYLTLDVEGQIREANIAAGKLLGVAREALLGKPLASFLTSRDIDV